MIKPTEQHRVTPLDYRTAVEPPRPSVLRAIGFVGIIVGANRIVSLLLSLWRKGYFGSPPSVGQYALRVLLVEIAAGVLGAILIAGSVALIREQAWGRYAARASEMLMLGLIPLSYAISYGTFRIDFSSPDLLPNLYIFAMVLCNKVTAISFPLVTVLILRRASAEN